MKPQNNLYICNPYVHTQKECGGGGEGLSTTQDHLGGGVGGSLAHFLGENMRRICYIYYDCNTS